MKPTECSETSAFNIQTPGKYPEENIPYLQHCEISKTTIKQYIYASMHEALYLLGKNALIIEYI
jgi:hypothetical protein